MPLSKLGSYIFDTPGTQNNPFISVAHAQQFNVPRGLYYFKNSINQIQELYYDNSNGGWILVGSSNASHSVIPDGQSRNTTSYFLNRNGTLGHLGTPNPNNDYLIGAWLDNYYFSRVRGIGFGRGSTNGTYTYPNNLGVYILCEWECDSYTKIVYKTAVPVQLSSDGGGIYSASNYFIMDAVKMDYTANSSFDANSNQSTIGWAAVNSSNGDPNGGTYLGHGTSEGSYEGWYNAAGTADNCQGWITWVR